MKHSMSSLKEKTLPLMTLMKRIHADHSVLFWLACWSAGHLEITVVHRNVEFDFLDSDLGPRLRIAFGPGFRREREHDAVDRLVGTHLGHALAHRTADEDLAFALDFEIGIGIEVVIEDVAILERDLQLIGVIAIHLVHAHVLHGIALALVIDKRAIEVSLFLQALEFILAYQFRVFFSLEWRNAPAGGAIIGAYGRHALDGEAGTREIGALSLISGRSLEAHLLDRERLPYRGNGFEFLQAATRGDVLLNDLVRRLGGSADGKAKQDCQQISL